LMRSCGRFDLPCMCSRNSLSLTGCSRKSLMNAQWWFGGNLWA